MLIPACVFLGMGKCVDSCGTDSCAVSVGKGAFIQGHVAQVSQTHQFNIMCVDVWFGVRGSGGISRICILLPDLCCGALEGAVLLHCDGMDVSF